MWWWLACTTSPDPGTGWTGETMLAPDPVPARFEGPVSLLFGPDARPIEALHSAVCHDRPGARDALRAAVMDTAPADRAAWSGVIGQVGCDDPGHCAWIHEQIDLAEPETKPAWRMGLWSCRDDASVRRFLTEAPADAVGVYLSAPWSHGPVPWVDRFETFAADALAADPVPFDWLAGLTHVADPRGRGLIRRVALTQPTPVRNELYAALDGTLDAGEAFLVETACADLARDCIGRSALTNFALAVDRGLDPRLLVAQHPNLRGALGELLNACVAEGSLPSAMACAEALVTLEPALARMAIASSPHASELRQVVVDDDEARAALEACEVPVPETVHGASYAELLSEAGRGMSARAVSANDTGLGLPYALAAAAHLDGAEFGWIGPPDWDGPRTFFAWYGGVRHQLVSEVPIGWDRLVGTQLVNALLAADGRDERFVPEVEGAVWVLADPDARRCLADAGLVRFLEPLPQQALE